MRICRTRDRGCLILNTGSACTPLAGAYFDGMKTILAFLALCSSACGEVLTFEEPPADWSVGGSTSIVDDALFVDRSVMFRYTGLFYLNGLDVLTPTGVTIVPRRDSNWNGIGFYVPGSPNWQHVPFNLGADIYTVQLVAENRDTFYVDNLAYSVPEPSSIVLAVLAICALLAAPMTLEKAKQYESAKELYRTTELMQAEKFLKESRASLAQAKRNGRETHNAAAKVKSANLRLKEVTKYKGEPILSITPQVGEIGILRTNIGKNTVKYRIDERRPGSLVISPEIPTQSVDVARDNKTILRTHPVVDTRFAEFFIVRDEQPNGFSHYTPMGRVYEVTGMEDGKPVLEVFDVATAKTMLSQSPDRPATPAGRAGSGEKLAR